jgi:hypothetical protein
VGAKTSNHTKEYDRTPPSPYHHPLGCKHLRFFSQGWCLPITADGVSSEEQHQESDSQDCIKVFVVDVTYPLIPTYTTSISTVVQWPKGLITWEHHLLVGGFKER